MKVPMKEKYVDEAFGIYQVFGYNSDGSVDICSNGATLMEYMNPLIAEKVVELHHEFREKLYKLLCNA